MKLNKLKKRSAGEPQNHSIFGLVKAQVVRGFILMTATLRHSSTAAPFSLNKPFGFIFIIVFLMIGTPTFVHADLDDLLSRFRLSINAQEEYNSNINLTPTNRIEDYITTVFLELRFSTLPRSETTGEFRLPSTAEETKYGINLDFLPGYVIYAKQTRDDYLSLSGNLDGWYTLDRKLTFRVREYVIRSEEPLERNYAAGALPNDILLGSQRRRAIYFRNVVQPSVEYRFGREDLFSINYSNNIYHNQSPLFEDSTENYINPKLTYWFNIRNGVSIEYALDLGHFQRSADLVGHIATGRYTYRFNPRTSIFGEYTFLKRDFEPPGIDYDVHRPSLGIEHAFSPTLSGSVQGGYFWQKPQRGSTTGGPYFNVSLTQRAEKTTYTLLLQGGYTEDYFTAENLGFAKYYRGIGTITHQLMERMTIGLLGSYEWAKYSSGDIDRIWGVGGNASYRILKWLIPSLIVSYRENNSNTPDREYSEYRAIFRVTASF